MPAPSDFTASPVFTTNSTPTASLTTQTVNLSYSTGTTIYIAFRHISHDKYLLALDDITISTSMQNNLEVNSTKLYNTAYGYSGVIPRSQVDSILIKQIVTNSGTSTQSNIVVNANIMKSGNNVFSGSSSSYSSLSVGNSDTLTIINKFRPPTTGNGNEYYETELHVVASGLL